HPDQRGTGMKKFSKYIFIILFGGSLYFILVTVLVSLERNAEGSSIKNFTDAIWYSLVTISTVGYGDYTPVSTGGRIIGVVFILFAIAALGLIIGEMTNFFQRLSEKRRLGMLGTSFENHTIILGWDSFSENVAIQLLNADKKVAIMTDEKNDVDLIYQEFSSKDVFVCFSDLKNYKSMELVNLKKAKTVFLNNGTDSDKLISILNIKKLCPTVGYVVILDDFNLRETFINAGVTYVLSKNEIASRLVASYIFEPAVAEFTKDLITSTNNENEYDIQQYIVHRNNPYAEREYGYIFSELKEKFNVIVIGIQKNNEKGARLIKFPDDSEIVEAGDYLIVVANGST
ncbi:MAG: ion transporter, partial [Clostridia bacterium]|nr:ion transporter [Clostridia bacterium]